MSGRLPIEYPTDIQLVTFNFHCSLNCLRQSGPIITDLFHYNLNFVQLVMGVEILTRYLGFIDRVLDIPFPVESIIKSTDSKLTVDQIVKEDSTEY